VAHHLLPQVRVAAGGRARANRVSIITLLKTTPTITTTALKNLQCNIQRKYLHM
jgi:hypothetical protein